MSRRMDIILGDGSKPPRLVLMLRRIAARERRCRMQAWELAL